MLRTAACFLLTLTVAACGGGTRSLSTWDGPLTVPYGGGANDPLPGGGGGSAPAIAWRILAEGTQSFPTSLTTPVARDMSAYAGIYALYYVPMPPGVGAPDVGPPAVDFGTEIVVAVFLGVRPTAGYSVGIRSMVPEGDGLRVEYEEFQPSPGQVVAQVVTQPFVMAAVTRVPGAVSFTGR